MTPILYESDEKEFWSKGLGPLSDAEKCTVTEERNGAYTLSMTYPIDGAQADKIANNRIIKADNAYDLKNQLFVIKTVTPIMTETGEISLSVYAEHISYITNDLSIPPELSLTGTAQQALDQWKDSLIGGDTSGITVDSDVTNTSSTLLSIQNVANARQALGGVEGSILYCWKGEYRFDNLHISLKKQRGTTANTLLSYGRNLLTFEQEQNISETYTTLYPYALVTVAGGMIQKLVTIDGNLVDSKYVSHYPNRKIKTYDFTSDFQNYRIGSKPSENAEEGVTYADLATIKKYLKGKALHFMTTNDIGVPKISTTITFADLSKTDDELAKFEKLNLCDKVPVRFEKLGINSTIKVTRTVWNVLTDSYDSLELGDLNMTIGEKVASVSAETSAIKTKVNQASVTAQIAADGTHNIFRTDDETEPIAKKVGDLWYKIDGEYTSMYQWDGKAWVLIVNTRDTADVRAELGQAKSDMAQAKTDAQNAYDEAIKATNTANGAKAQTTEALKQVKQANDSYTTLAKEVAGNKANADADYKRVSDSYTALSKEVADNKANADADYQKAQSGIAQAKTDAQTAYDEAIKATNTANGAKAQTDEALKQAKQANDSYTTLAKEVAGNKASTDADYQKAQAAIAQAQKDLSGMTGAVAEVKKGQGELSAKVAGKVDNTVYQTYVTQTNQALSEKLVASDLNGYAKTVDVTKSIDGVKTTVADNAGKISTVQTDINGVKTNVKNAQGDITSIKTDVSGVKTTVSSNTGKITQLTTDVNGVKSSVSSKVDKTVYQSYVAQTDKALSAKLTASDLNGYAKTVDVTKSIDGVKTTIADNAGKITTVQTDINGVKSTVKNAQGDISALQTDAKSIKATVSDHTGKITQLVTDVNGVKTTVGNAQGDIATLQTDTKGIKATVSNNTGKISTIQTDVNGIKTNVKNAQGDISSLQTDAKGIKATVSDHTGKITQLTADVNGVRSSVSSKVDKTTYQSYVTQTDKALSAKLTASDLNGYAKTADVKQTTDGLSASITKVQGDLANQATELIGKKSFKDRDVGDWYCADLKTRATLDGGGPVDGLYNWIRPSFGYDLCYNNAEIPVKAGDVFYVEAFSPNFHDQNNRLNIILRADLRYTQNGSVKWQEGPSVTIPPDQWGWLKGTVTVPDGVTGVIPYFSTRNDVDFKAAKTYLAYASFVKLDDYTQSQLNTLSGKITATSDRLSSVYTKSETDAKLNTKVEQSVLTQTSNNLSASIAKNSKILSSAGLVNENAYINANKIALNGKTLMTNATINDAFIGNLSANKITTGTLNAANVNLINVNASNISTGTLSGVKITSTGKDPSGTSSTTNIQSGYIDTNVINCSDYILVGKADADPRKRWQTKRDKWGMWFQTPAKLNGHTGNAPSDWQSEWQGFIRGDGWNYETASVTGNGASGIAIAITPEQIWGRPYGGDYFQIGVWEPRWGETKEFKNGHCSPRFIIDEIGQFTGHPHSISLGDAEEAGTETYNWGNLHIKPGGANHGIRTAWVAWSDWGLNQKVPCIVQDADNWGGIAFPANGRAVLFTHNYRVNTDMLPRDGGVYNGWGS